MDAKPNGGGMDVFIHHVLVWGINQILSVNTNPTKKEKMCAQ